MKMYRDSWFKVDSNWLKALAEQQNLSQLRDATRYTVLGRPPEYRRYSRLKMSNDVKLFTSLPKRTFIRGKV